MQAILLAGGKSSRMSPLSDKSLTILHGKTLLEHLIENAIIGGVENFIIVANQENYSQIEQILITKKIPGKIVQQGENNQGMADAIRSGLQEVSAEQELLILSGNDWVGTKPFAELKKIRTTEKPPTGVILAQKVDKYFPGGYLEIDEKNIIKSIVEKPEEGKEPSNLVNIVLHYFRQAKTLQSKFSQENFLTKQGDDIYEQILQEIFSTEKILALPFSGNWKAIKYPWDWLAMNEQWLENSCEKISPKADISPQATLSGEGIVIEDGVKIFAGSHIVGPVFLGKNCIIGQNCLIRASHLGENCIIGFGSEVARSFLQNNISTHHSYIGDSVVESGTNFGAFSCTTNLRLDKRQILVNIKGQKINSQRQKLGSLIGKNAQIGSGAKTMPGAKIPSGKIIMPNEVYK